MGTVRVRATLIAAAAIATAAIGPTAVAPADSREGVDDNPVGATAMCADHLYSHSGTRSGTCSHHGGVAQWCPCGSPPPSASGGTSGPAADADQHFLSLMSQIPGVTVTDPAALTASGRPVDIVGTDIRHFELSQLRAQASADYVTSRTRATGDDDALVTVGYIGGGSAAVPRFVLDVQGHEWEKRLVDVFLPLREFGTGLKLRVVQRALADSPHWTPQDVSMLFEQLLS
ncbi:MAG: DUF3761 domain-containing protein [Mycobacterium sp.]|uniref:DUF3761 domain-containing protein n=1 Tax=Mycobacterium sp. TaxID=1785 RepID=UPI003C7079B8